MLKMSNDKIKEKVRDEIIDLFNEIYCGVEFPKIDKAKIDFFVKKALNMFETELFYNKKLEV